MPLATGSRLGPYEVVAALGAGGMGEVYRARDTRLDRTVAIKVLPPHLAVDPQFRNRFDREARAISSLNHPHICALYDVGHHDDTDFLVMEFLDGESLAARLEKGAMPLTHAMAIAIEIAEALDAAHRAGIVHRDLKPGNVMLTKGGAKLLDFGLAKPAAPAVATGDLSMGQTTPANLTTQGTILGTFQYMAPEQIEGREADARTDIFAFGAVAFEMLATRKAFEGKSHASLVGAIMHSEPPLVSSVRPLSPPALDRVVTKCLAKDPDNRWQTARDLLDELRWIERNAAAGRTAPSDATTKSWNGRPLAATMAMAAVVLLAAAVGAGVAWRARAPAPREPIVFTVTTPSTADPSSFALSPDGRQLAFTAMDTDGQQKLWIRPLDSSAPRVLPGSIDAATPFWSHDSRSVAFFTPGFLKRIDQSGGPAQTISGVALGTALGGTWSERDVILFASATSGGILRVAAAGGEAAHVTSLGTGEGTHAWPMFMPDGRHFVYLKARPAAGSSELVWRALDSTEERVVRRMPSKAAYSPTGHLVFRLDGPLVGQRFDAEHGSVSGDTIQLASDMWTGGGIASRAAIDLSPAGVLAYRPGEEAGVVAQLTWFDREGNVLAKVGSPGDYRNLTIDLAGDHAAANTSGDVWGFDVKRGTTSRLTFDPAADSDPIFSPDGRWLVFYSARNPPGIYRKAANGAGADELVAQTGLLSYTRDWSSDGRFVLFVKGSDAGGGADLWVLPMEGDRKPFAYLATPANEEMARFSPDADWVAYHSSETGRREVFVQDFPVKGAKFQASTAGGTDPRWRRDGRELFYLGPDGRLMSMTVETKPEFRLDAPKAVFQTPLLHLSVDAQRRYAISADGQRFLMNVPVGVGALAPITVVVNWSPALPIH